MRFIRADVDCLDRVGIVRVGNAREGRTTLIDRQGFGGVQVTVEIKRICRQVCIASSFDRGASLQQGVGLSLAAVVGEWSKRENTGAHLIAVGAVRQTTGAGADKVERAI